MGDIGVESDSLATNLCSSERNLVANFLTEASEDVSSSRTTTDEFPVLSSMSPIKKIKGIREQC